MAGRVSVPISTSIIANSPEADRSVERLGRQGRLAHHRRDSRLPGFGQAMLEKPPRHALSRMIGMRGEVPDVADAGDDLAAARLLDRPAAAAGGDTIDLGNIVGAARQQLGIGARHVGQGGVEAVRIV